MLTSAIELSRQALRAEGSSFRDQHVLLWFAICLTLVCYYSALGLQEAYVSDYILADDARQHVFWMLRYVDGELLSNDIIAEYYQAIAPFGYKLIYFAANLLGVHPFDFSKYLPVIITVSSAYLCFRLSLLLVPLPSAAFVVTILFIQTYQMQGDIYSGTAKAFSVPLLLAFLCAYVKRQPINTTVIAFLQIAFFPITAVLSGTILAFGLVRFDGWLPILTKERKEFYFAVPCMVVILVLLSVYASQISSFGPIVSADHAREMPEFLKGGRNAFFSDNWFDFFSMSRRVLIPTPVMTPVTLLFCLGFPLVIWHRKRFPIVAKIIENLGVLKLLFFAAIGLFILAHLLVFNLYVPTRYAHLPLRIIFAVLAGFTLIILLDRALKWINDETVESQMRKYSFGILLLLFLLLVPGYHLLVKGFPFTGYTSGPSPELYQFLRQQPKSVVIASLSAESDNISSFAERSVLFSREHSIAYHRGYYDQIRARIEDVIRAQYTPSSEKLIETINAHSIDIWLLESDWQEPEYLLSNSWFLQFAAALNDALSDKESRQVPVLQEYVSDCSTFRDVSHIAVSTRCILSKL
ncbi:MAG: hypothetical protein AAF478_08885 [Pseudomonadota bacterium]